MVAEASTNAYREVSRSPLADRGRPYDYGKGDRPLVTAPAFSDGRLYCRLGGEIVGYELERKDGGKR
jgi:hypothetical protein